MFKSTLIKVLSLFVVIALVAPLNSLYAEILVSMTGPADESTFPVAANITLTADVQVTDATLRDVRFYSGSSLVGKATGSNPATFVWEKVKSGNYDVFARVRDNAGNQVDSDPIHIRVGNISRGDKIINGSFDFVTSPWSLQNNEGAVSSFTRKNDGYFDDSTYIYIDISNGGTADWHVQIFQAFPVIADHTYEVFFMADAEEKKTITVAIQEGGGDYATYLWQNTEIDGAALYGPFTYDCVTDDKTSQFKLCVGGNNVNVMFDQIQVIDRTLTSVASHNLFANGSAIKTYELMNNYPNPFNMNTSIQYRLSKAANVTLDVYNVQGQLVKTLVTENMAAGLYTANWDGTDNNSFVVPSGVYVFRMNIPSENVQLTRKVLLVK